MTFEPTLPNDRAHSGWRRASLALIASLLWLLLAFAVTAASGGGPIAMLLGATAVLWLGIAAVENHDAYAAPASRRTNRPLRRQAIPSRG